MAGLDRADAALIGEEVAKSLRTTGFASGAMSFAQARDQVTNGIFNVGSSFGKLSTGAFNLKDALDDTNRVFKIFGGVGEVLGTVFTGTINHLKEMNDSMITSGRYGVTFNQDLIKYTSQLAQAGISFERFNTLLQSANKQIMGLGVNAQHSAEIFIGTNRALMLEPLVLRMNLMGIGLTEVQDQLAVTGTLFKSVNTASKDQDGVFKMLKEATISAVVEIDNMARVTGRSRQDIQKDIDAQQNERNVRFLRAAMDKEQVENYNRAGAMLANLPKQFNELYTTLMVKKGPMSAQQGEQLAALDVLSPGLSRLFMQLSQSRDAQEQERLRQQFEFLYGRAMADNQRIQREITNLVNSNAGYAEVVKDLVGGDRSNYGIALAQQFRNAGGDFGEFQRLQQQNANLRQAVDKALLTAQAPGSAGAQVSQILLLMDRALKLGPMVVAKTIENIEGKLGEKLKGLEPAQWVDKVLNLQNKIPEVELKQMFEELIGSTAVDTTDPTDRPRGVARYGETADRPLQVHVTNSRLNVTQDASQQFPSIGLRPQRIRGTYGATGEWWEDFGSGTTIDAHNVQSVVRKDQAVDFSMYTLKETGILAGLAASLKNAVAEKSPANTDMVRELSAAITALPKQIPEIKFPTNLEDDRKILADGIDKLNTKMEKLITAVEDGSRGTVKAVRNTSNLIG